MRIILTLSLKIKLLIEDGIQNFLSAAVEP